MVLVMCGSSVGSYFELSGCTQTAWSTSSRNRRSSAGSSPPSIAISPGGSVRKPAVGAAAVSAAAHTAGFRTLPPVDIEIDGWELPADERRLRELVDQADCVQQETSK